MSVRASHGQAMAEFAVALGLLALLLLGLPVLQRYHQLQFAAIGAVREGAWVASWAPTGGASTGEGARVDRPTLARRWLSEGEAGVADNGGAGGQGLQPYVRSYSATTTLGATPGAGGQAERALLLPMRPLQWLGSGFDLQAGRFLTSSVTLSVASPDTLPEPFGGLALDLQEHHALLADGWGASGPAQVARRAGGLVPTSVVASVPGLTSVGTTLLSLLEPQFRHFCPGAIDPEVVPADRLVQGRADAPVTAWRPSC